MIEKAKTPAETLRRAARWVERNAEGLVAGDGLYVVEGGLDLDVTIRLGSAEITTVTVAGSVEYIVDEGEVS